MKNVRAFAVFWYDFIIGDDWLVAIGIIAALAATYGLSRTSIPAWWVVPVAVGVLLPISLKRAMRKS